MDVDVLARRRDRGRRRGRRRHGRRQHEPRDRPGRAEALRHPLRRRARARSRAREVLRGARAAHGLPDLDRDRRAHRRRPRLRGRRGRPRSSLMYVARSCGGGKVGANLARILLRVGPRGDADRAARATASPRSRRSSSTSSSAATRPSSSSSSAPASSARRTSSLAVTGDDEDNLVICQLAKEKYDVPKVIARVNDPRNQAALRPARHLADDLRDLEHHGADRARGARARARPPARAAAREPRDRRGADRRRTRRRRQARREARAARRARASSP